MNTIINIGDKFDTMNYYVATVKDIRFKPEGKIAYMVLVEGSLDCDGLREIQHEMLMKQIQHGLWWKKK